ncbi:MAG TPA: prolipoprotein diacylglyceryl transferase [Gaiellaceae bacterium]|nr:prolipoprotein diacylglyceryl transferase [Gaiellaceae bacterium]
MAALIASIPSPGKGAIDLGPLTIHMYGLTLLVAIVACIGLTGLRWTRKGGDWDLVLRVAVWGVAAGVVGARLYHDLTSWSEVPDPKWRGIFAVWEGGLGIWGGILFGCIAGAIVLRRSAAPVFPFLDAAAPGLLLAQGIGRLGNWWNQELFGKPTDLPWGLEIDPERRPLEYFDEPTFHPTFLYEMVWDFAGVGLLLLLSWRFRFRPPALFALYISYYCFGRFFEELLRVDPAHEFGPLRLNAWVSVVVFILSTAFFVWWQFLRREPGERSEERPRAPRGPKMAIPKGRVR